MNWFTDPGLVPSTLLATLLDSLLKGSVVIALAAGAAWTLRRNSAAARHSVWSAAIAAQLLIPLLVIAMPTWRVPLIEEPAWVAEPAAISAGSSTESNPTAIGMIPINTPSGGATPGATPDATPTATPAATQVASPSTPPSTTRAPLSLIAILAAVWFLGCLAILVRLAAGTAVVSRLAGKGERVTDERWLGLMHRLAVKLGIQRPLTLMRGDALGVPVTWGVVYPVVLLPADADSWSEERRHYVLVHEMAHVKRLDAFTQLVSQFVLAIFWCNPLVWMAAAQMRRERENACDDYVISHGTKPSLYASDLLELVREIDTDGHRAAAPAFAALAMARRSEFEGRMLSILDPRLRRHGITRQGVLMGLLATLLVAAPLAAFSPYSADRTTPVDGLPPNGPAQMLDAGTHAPVATARIAVQSSLPALGAKSTTSADEGCETASNSTSTITNSHSPSEDPNDGTLRFIRRRPGHCVEAQVKGVVTFTDDERDVADLGRGARLRFIERTGRRQLEIVVTSEAGRQQRTYLVDGERAAFDEAGREWFASMILTLVRETGYNAAARVSRLRQQGGTARVLSEIEQISSSSAKRAYYAALLDSVNTFPDSTLTRIITGMHRDFRESSGDMRSALERIPPQRVRSAQARQVFVGAVASIESDGDKSSIIGVVIPMADRQLQLALMNVVPTIESDGDKARLLVNGAAAYLTPKDQLLRESFFRAAETIDSDGDLTRVLVTAVPFAHADAEVAAAVIRLTQHMESDGDIASVLTTIATQRLLSTAQLKDAFMAATRSIQSDGDLARVLRAAMPE